MDNLFYYWQTIPIGRDNAITYPELCLMWNMNARKVRHILHELSYCDTGDDYILIRSSKGKGFYKTDNRADIELYAKEVTNRARHTFAPLRKIRRVLKSEKKEN